MRFVEIARDLRGRVVDAALGAAPVVLVSTGQLWVGTERRAIRARSVGAIGDEVRVLLESSDDGARLPPQRVGSAVLELAHAALPDFEDYFESAQWPDVLTVCGSRLDPTGRTAVTWALDQRYGTHGDALGFRELIAVWDLEGGAPVLLHDDAGGAWSATCTAWDLRLSPGGTALLWAHPHLDEGAGFTVVRPSSSRGWTPRVDAPRSTGSYWPSDEDVDDEGAAIMIDAAWPPTWTVTHDRVYWVRRDGRIGYASIVEAGSAGSVDAPSADVSALSSGARGELLVGGANGTLYVEEAG